MRSHMATENQRERWRYIAFKVEGGAKVARKDFLGALISAAEGTPVAKSFRITVFEGDFGILKVPHKLKDDAIAMLRSVESVGGAGYRIVTLKTSGTIRTLKERYKRHIAGSLGIVE